MIDPEFDLTFEQALGHLKEGRIVARRAWHGYGSQFLFLLKAGTVPSAIIFDPTLKAVVGDAKHFDAAPAIRMKTEDDRIITGWLPNIEDLFTDDWQIVRAD